MKRQIQIVLRTDGPLWDAKAKQEMHELLSLAKDNMHVDSFYLSPGHENGMLITIGGFYGADVILDGRVPRLRIMWVEGKSLICHQIDLSKIRKIVL